MLDDTFQDLVHYLADSGHLPRSSEDLPQSRDYSETGFRIAGAVLKSRTGLFDSTIDVSAFGTVAVYFRARVRETSVDEFVGYWVFRCCALAVNIHALMGSTGIAHVWL